MHLAPAAEGASQVAFQSLHIQARHAYEQEQQGIPCKAGRKAADRLDALPCREARKGVEGAPPQHEPHLRPEMQALGARGAAAV